MFAKILAELDKFDGFHKFSNAKCVKFWQHVAECAPFCFEVTTGVVLSLDLNLLRVLPIRAQSVSKSSFTQPLGKSATAGISRGPERQANGLQDTDLVRSEIRILRKYKTRIVRIYSKYIYIYIYS